MKKITSSVLLLMLLTMTSGCATLGDVLSIAAGVASIATFGPGIGFPTLDTALDVWNIAGAAGTVRKALPL